MSNDIKKLVNNEEWQALRKSLKGTWKEDPVKSAQKLKNYLGDNPSKKKIQRVVNYIGALRRAGMNPQGTETLYSSLKKKLEESFSIKEEETLDQIYSFINELSPDDIGKECFGIFCIHYEGFTDMCWDAAEEENKSIEDLEEEMTQEWIKKESISQENIIDIGWNSGEDVFYLIYKNNL